MKEYIGYFHTIIPNNVIIILYMKSESEVNKADEI